MGMSMLSGEAEGFGDGEAVAEGICIPGMFICSGEALDWDGCDCSCIFMPGIFISIF